MAFTPAFDKRYGWAAVAGVLIAAALWGLVALLGSRASAEQTRLERQLATIDPELQRLGAARQEESLASARLAALRAFSSQGPRLAKVLEAFSRAASPDVAITEFRLEPAVGAWILSVSGQAEGQNSAQAQITFSRFLSALKESPLLGDPTSAPALSVKNLDPEPAKDPGVQVGNTRREDWEPVPVDQEQRGRTGPAFIEVARDGRIYRIPNRQFAAGRNYADEEERLRRRRLENTRRLELPEREEPVEPAGRRPGALLEFTVKYEVRK